MDTPMTAAAPSPLDPAAHVAFRPMRPADMPFVLHAWMMSARAAPYNVGQDDAAYFDEASGYKGLVLRILRHPSTLVLVACGAEDSDHIYGFACGYDDASAQGVPVPVLHYIYVKELFRRNGIARTLLYELVISGYLRGARKPLLCTARSGDRTWPWVQRAFGLEFDPTRVPTKDEAPKESEE
jgi:GNAT superfamily N-acetyltransferase